jgi:hypothetical protein
MTEGATAPPSGDEEEGGKNHQEAHGSHKPAGRSRRMGALRVSMPIRMEYRKYYDARWRKFRLTALEAAGNVCQRCGQAHRLLNVAHLSHDPADRRSLAVLCPSCHAKNDTPQRLAMTRRNRAKRSGQLWLSEEIQWGPFPMRTWPLRLRQMTLF